MTPLRTCLLVLALAAPLTVAHAQASDPVVNDVIRYARDVGLHGDRPDWPRVHGEADALVAATTPLAQAPRHIALVAGPRTASSGEILALGFKGQDNVRVFGRPTAGATTANRSFRLANGGLLALTTSRILDRNGLHHAGPVIPDVDTASPLPAARAWLAEGCGSARDTHVDTASDDRASATREAEAPRAR